MEEVFSGIYRIVQTGWPGGLMPPVNIYLLPGPDGLIFDAGYGTPGTVAQLAEGIGRIERHFHKRKMACRFTRVLPSHVHPDHFAGLCAVSRITGARIWLTAKMARRIKSARAYAEGFALDPAGVAARARKSLAGRLLDMTEKWSEPLYHRLYGTSFVERPDRIIDEETTLVINGRLWQVLAVPGHSPDHIALFDPTSGVLLGGDNVLRTVTTWLGPPDSDLFAYIQTLKRMAALPGLKIILGAHGSPVTRPRERIGEIIAWRESRTRQVLEAVLAAGSKGIKVGSLVRRFYHKEGWGKRYIAEGWVLLTLEYLVSKGRVQARDEGRGIVFLPADRNDFDAPLM